MRSPTPHLPSSDTNLEDQNLYPRCHANRPGGSAASRARGLLAAGLLAVTAAAPAAIAAAAEPDSERDGSAAAHGGAADPAVSPNYDPGGNAAQLPDVAPAPDADQPPEPDGDDQGAPVDQPANTDVDDPVVDSGDGEASSQRDAPGQTTNTAGGSAVTGPPPPPAVDAGGAQPVVSGPPVPADVPAIQSPVPGAVVGASHTLTVRQRPARQPVRRRSARPAGIATSTAGGGSVTVPRQVATTAPAPQRDPGRRARRGDRMHIVLAGESLWAIASDLLGRDATDAQVAREVQRLWRLNGARIATGDPDLLYAGTKLVLRYPSSNTAPTR